MARVKNVARRVVNAAIKYRWWDYSFMLEIEKACLLDMSEKFISKGNNVSSEYDAQWMNICVKLIDIILEKDVSYKCEETDELMRLGKSKIKKWLFINVKYVNTRNAFRFTCSAEEQFKDVIYKDELRKIKALHLYNNIRTNYMLGWWD